VCRAKGGSRARDVLERQVPDSLEDRPDLFVVAVGANDAIHGTPTWTFRRQLGDLFDALSPVAPVVSVGVGDLSVIPRLPLTLRPIVAHRSSVVDRAHALVSADRERVVRIPAGKLSDALFRARGPRLFAADLFHPNHEGHRVWSELFLPYVELALHLRTGALIDLRARESVRS
jgi:lysophospholipase L1-like esterase